jgi:hypothetical protein
MAQAALPAGPTKQEHPTNIPKPFKRQAKGGKGGKEGFANSRGTWDALVGLVDKISAAVQIVDGNIGRRVVQWFYTRSVLLLQGAFLCSLSWKTNAGGRRRKPLAYLGPSVGWSIRRLQKQVRCTVQYSTPY